MYYDDEFDYKDRYEAMIDYLEDDDDLDDDDSDRFLTEDDIDLIEAAAAVAAVDPEWMIDADFLDGSGNW